VDEDGAPRDDGVRGQADLVAGARGEFIFPHFLPAYDGMFAAAKLLEALAAADAG
jgi:hypothetical protein